MSLNDQTYKVNSLDKSNFAINPSIDPNKQNLPYYSQYSNAYSQQNISCKPIDFQGNVVRNNNTGNFNTNTRGYYSSNEGNYIISEDKNNPNVNSTNLNGIYQNVTVDPYNYMNSVGKIKNPQSDIKTDGLTYDWQKHLTDRNQNLIMTTTTNNSSTNNYSKPAFHNNPSMNGYNLTNNTNPAYSSVNYNNVTTVSNQNNVGLNNNINSNITNKNNNILNNTQTPNSNLIINPSTSSNNGLTSQTKSVSITFDAFVEQKNKETNELKEKIKNLSAENVVNLNTIKNLTEENTNLQSIINQLKHNTFSDTNRINQTHLIEMENKIKKLETENLKLKSDFKSSKQDPIDPFIEITKSGSEMTDEIFRNTKIQFEIEKKYEALLTERNNLKSYTCELQTLYGDIIEEVKELRALGKNAKSLEASLEKVTEERNNLKTYTSELQTLYGDMIEEVKELRPLVKKTKETELAFEKLTEERNNLKNYTSELQTLYGEIIEEVKELRPLAKNAKQIEMTLEKVTEERNNLKGYTSELQTLYGDIIEEVKSLREKIKDYEFGGVKNIVFGKTGEKSLDCLRQEYTNISNQKDAIEIKIRESEKIIENMKSKIQMIKIEKESLVETITRLNKENESLRGESGRTKSNLNTTVNDLPELFKLELEEKEKAIQILNCSLEERDKIIEQIKVEQNKIMSRNKGSHHELINTIEDLKFKIINLEKEINEKNNFITGHNNELNLKKLEADNLIFENKQLKDQMNLIPTLKNEVENLKNQLKKNISCHDELKEQIIARDSRIVKLEKSISSLKNELSDKESALQLANDECNTTKLYEKKRDIIHSTLLDIRDLKEKISKDKNNLTLAYVTSTNILNDNSRDFNINENETLNNMNSNYMNATLNINPNVFTNKIDREIKKNNVIEEATPRTEGLDSYRKITEADINFFQNTIKNFDLNLLTEYEMILNGKNWNLISNWFGFSKKSKNYRLKLVFKASRDGFSHIDFREKCLGIPNTMVIAVTNYDQVIGGFTPLVWENAEEHVYLKDDSERSFLFSVNRKEKLRLINSDHAICVSPDSGPIFGGGSDFEIVDNCNVEYNRYFRVGHSYDYEDSPESFFGSRRFLIKDYEVYEVLDFY